MKQQRIMIYTGGTLGAWALQDIRSDDVIVGADRGAFFLVQQGLKIDLALGDFDSVNETELQQIKQNSKTLLSCDPLLKDLTDTEMAFDWALNQHPKEIVIFGALGTRFDHSLANVHLLRKALKHEIACTIVDAHNRIHLIDCYVKLEKTKQYNNVSLLPLSLEVTGIRLVGFAYPLYNATLSIGQSLGISNYIIESFGQVHIQNGLLLVIESMD
ncbi:MAG: thiamine diphosphokinase [Bacilli bacterium]|nr:thiamine diphosphokinase [Bacilli bacterium]